MHPKTFQINIRSSQDQTNLPSIMVYVHVDTKYAALGWAAETFPGINTAPTLRAWENPPIRCAVGNSLLVSVVDCDRYTSHKRVNGKLIAQPRIVGEFRRSSYDVADSLRVASERLLLAHSENVRYFRYLIQTNTGNHERLQAVKESALRALQWSVNTRNAYIKYLQTYAAASLKLPPTGLM